MALVLALFFATAAAIVWLWKFSPKPVLQKPAGRSPTKIKTSPASAVKAAHAQRATSPKAEAAQYHSVSIKFKNDACAAVKEIANQRFLTRDAPSIPLAKCDAAKCHCGYAHHDDRREEEEDRRCRYSIQTDLYRQTPDRDRRKKSGRRKNDSDY